MKHSLPNTLFLLAIFAFITLPAAKTPFHPDESTTLWTSRDFHTLFVAGDVDAIRYQAPPLRSIEQHNRILMNNLAKMSYGLAWWSLGLGPSDLNGPWDWGGPIEWNRVDNRVPSAQILTAARLVAAWMLALSCVPLLAISRRILAQIGVWGPALLIGGWLAVLAYALHPAVLLNGRRAMNESALLLPVLLSAWLALMLLRYKTWRWVLALGVMTGVAFSSKHSSVFPIVMIYAGVFLMGRARLVPRLALATLLSVFVFIALNPLWWGDTLALPEVTYDERRALLDGQLAGAGGGYDTWGERLSGLWRQAVAPTPQYFEDERFAADPVLAAEIAEYERWGAVGAADFPLWGLLRVVLLLAGLAALVAHRGAASGWMLIWLGGMVIVTLAATPLDWARYYIPLIPPLGIVMGLGGGVVLRFALFRDKGFQIGQ